MMKPQCVCVNARICICVQRGRNCRSVTFHEKANNSFQIPGSRFQSSDPVMHTNNMKYRPKRHHRCSLLREMKAKLDIVSAKYPHGVPAECCKIQQQKHSVEGMETKHNNLIRKHAREMLWVRFISAIVVSIWSNNNVDNELLGIVCNQNYRSSTHIQVTDWVHHRDNFLLTILFFYSLYISMTKSTAKVP